jgi:5-formyltetrahydrofolate cyclo-ligase
MEIEPANAKAEIRAAALARRDALDPALRREYSRVVIGRIVAMGEFRAAQSVLAYCSFGSELETESFLGAVLDAGKRLLIPRVNRAEGRLDICRVENVATDLVTGVWGIREPHAPSCAPHSAGEIGFALVPGVAFDRRGGRIGYGRGYYDRLLASRIASHAVAGAFETQIVDFVPMERHDMRVDLVVTEAGMGSG